MNPRPAETNEMLPKRGDPLPSGEEKTESVRAMFDVIAPRYDMVNRLLTFRMDVRWRSHAVDQLGLRHGSRVLDLACGTGDLCFDLEERGITAVGADLSFGMLAAAPREFRRFQADAARLPMADAALDGATCGFALRNFTDLGATLREVARVVRQGGRIALLDVAEPPNPLVGFGHRLYFNEVVPRIGGLLSDRDAYSYLPRSVAYLPQRDELLATVAEAGFTDVTHQLLSGGISQLICATRAPGTVTTTNHP
ncbi:MAG: ubiquinone/menaquinone biosynthesis methyltransferase [Microthrixaceae bacterium]